MANSEIKIIVTATGAEQAAKVLADVAKSGAQLGSITVTGAKRAEDALNSLGGTAKRVFEIFSGVSLANATAQIASFAKASIQELTRMGLENQRVEESFSRMADAVGVHADTMLSSLKRASSGIVDTTSIMLASSKALAQGLNSEQLTRVMETARATATLAGKTVSESYNAIAEAVTNLNAKQLREFGIVIDLAKAYETYARALGTSAGALNEAGQRAAFLQAIDEQTRRSRQALTQGELTNAQEIERAKAVWSDFFATMAGGFATAYTASVKWGARFLEQVQIEKERLDDLGVAWNNYMKRRLEAQGGTLAQGSGLTFRTTAADMRALRNIGDDATSMSQSLGGPDAKAGIDLVKDALLKAEQAMKQYSGAMQIGTASSAQFTEKMHAQVAALKAVPEQTDEIKQKILDIQTAIAAVDFARFQQGLTGALQATQAWGSGLLNSVKESVAQWNTTVEQGAVAQADIRVAMLAADRVTLAKGLADHKLNEAQKFQLEQQYAALAIQLAEAKSAARIAVWARETAALKNFIDRLNSDVDAAMRGVTQGVDEQARALRETAEAQKRYADAMDVMMTGLDGSADGFDQNAAAVKRSGDAFKESLAAINREADLVGGTFDAAGARLNEFKKRILELQAIKNPTGAVLAEVEQLKAQFAETQDFIRWRDMFQDVFSSVGRTVNTLVEGVILGTQTMSEAFKKLGQSIIINFVNAVIQQALNPLMKAAAAVVAGLFAPGSSAAGGGAGSSGDIDFGGGGAQAVADAAGGLTKAMQFANTATTSFGTSISSIGSGLWGIAGGSGGALGPAFTGVGAIDVAAAGGSLTDIGAAAGAAIGPISALSVGLAGVGAAVAAFGTIMDFVNGKTEAAIGGVVGAVSGAVAGGVIGSFISPGAGTILGALAGGALGDWLGSMLGGLFGGGPSNYALKRAKAADEANAYLGGATQGYQSALETRSTAQILAALQSTGTGVNPLRTELVLTSNVAAQLGITGQREGDTIIARWTDVNEAQMNELIALFKLNPEMVPGAVRGAGDVGYLAQDKAHEFSAQLELGAEALLTAFTGLGAVTDKINQVARDLTGAAQEALPPSLAQEFADGIVNPIRDRMLAVINSGLPVKEMQKQLDTINTELQGKVEAWNMFAVAIKQATVVDALIPADLHDKFRAVMEPAYADMLNTMRNGTSAQAALAADHFAKQTQAWAAFSDAVQAQVGVEMLLEPIADLGDRFSAAMQPIYDKILASLVAGNGAIALAQAQTFAKLTQAWAAFGSTAAKSIDVESLLPDDLGDKFRARMQPEYDKILSTLVSGNAEVASAMITTFDKQLAAWASMGQTVTRITGELAGLTGNIDGSVEAWVTMQQQMDGAVTRAQAAFETALAGGNVERIAATAAALHDAAVTRLQAELQMLEMIKKIEAATLAASAGLSDLVTTIATLEVATSGGLGTLEALLEVLGQVATTGASTEQRLWAVHAGLKAITAVLPGLIEQFASFTEKADFLAAGMQTTEQLRFGPGGPAGIAPAVLSGALPFLTALQELVDTASTGKLALLQQQAEAFQSLASAAVAAVNQWAQAALAGARAAAAEVIEGARTEAARRTEVARTEAERRQALIDAARDKALAAIDAEIKATEKLAEAQQEARRAEIDALQEMISKSKEWASAVESMGKFIQSLKVGPLGPGNPADKLRQSQDAFSKALQAYTANPTAGGLADLQGLAQTMLGLAEPISSKPSPQFQALSANTIKQLEAAQSLAQAQMTDSKVLQAQLDTLLAMDKAATKAAKDQLEALHTTRDAVSKDFEQQTKDLRDALDKYLGGIERNLKSYVEAVELALKTQVTAIEAAAKAEATAINTNLIGALNANAAQQATAIKDQKDASDALVRALRSTEFGAQLGDIATYAAQRQDVAIGILESIRNGISLAVGTPLAQGSERVTEGLYHLHDGEMVVPKGAADRIRSAEMGAGLPDATSQAVAEIIANWDTYSGQQQQDIIAAYNAADEATQQSAERAASYWQASAAQTARAATRPADLSNTGPWAPGSGDPLRDPWMAHAVQTKAGDWIYEPGYGPGATPGSVVKFGTGPAPGTPPPGTAPTAPYLPPGPPWLYRGAGSTNLGGGSMTYGGGSQDGGGPITVVVKLDGKTIGEATLPTIQGDARSGKMRTIILETRAK